jgi:hypothetical protein
LRSSASRLNPSARSPVRSSIDRRRLSSIITGPVRPSLQILFVLSSIRKPGDRFKTVSFPRSVVCHHCEHSDAFNAITSRYHDP